VVHLYQKDTRSLRFFFKDIDIHIRRQIKFKINERTWIIRSRQILLPGKNSYNWLVKNIKIDGIVAAERDRLLWRPIITHSGGIRLIYKTYLQIEGIKRRYIGKPVLILLRQIKLTICPWSCRTKANNTKLGGLDIIDNRATDIVCYDRGYICWKA
jgi:hypothetical protein